MDNHTTPTMSSLKRKNSGSDEGDDKLTEHRTKRFLHSVIASEEKEASVTGEASKRPAAAQDAPEEDSTDAKTQTAKASGDGVIEDEKTSEGHEEKALKDKGNGETFEKVAAADAATINSNSHEESKKEAVVDGEGGKSEDATRCQEKGEMNNGDGENKEETASTEIVDSENDMAASQLANDISSEVHRKVEKGRTTAGINREAAQGVAFPERLFDLLNQEVVKDTLFWNDDGNKLIVNTAKVQAELLDKHFQRSKFASFARKLKRWGFKRCPNIGIPNHSAYEHVCFRKDRKELLNDIYDKRKEAINTPASTDVDKKPTTFGSPSRGRNAKADPEGRKVDTATKGDEAEKASPASRIPSLVRPQGSSMGMFGGGGMSMAPDPRMMQSFWQMQQMNPMYGMGFPNPAAMLAQQQQHHRLMMAGMGGPPTGPFVGAMTGPFGQMQQQQQPPAGDEEAIRRFLLLEQLQKSNNQSNQPRRF